jgi:hypothetical protein
MKTTSYRVTPVTRWNLTRAESDPEKGAGSVGTVAEFTNQHYAEEVGRAMAAQTPGAKFTPMDGETETSPYMQYVIVERTVGDVDCRCWYADYPAQAEQYREQLAAHFNREFRVFSRPTEGRSPQMRVPDGKYMPLDLTY